MRQHIYDLEMAIEVDVLMGRVVALVDPQDVARVYLCLLAIIDHLAGAYLNMAGDRDKWKGAVDLAMDEGFWRELDAMTKGGTK